MAEKPQLGQSPYLHLDAGYTQSFDYDGNGNAIYQGWTVPYTANKASALWRICRFTYDGNNRVTDIQWADGNEMFDNVWNNRVSLTYK
jgi:hypothetical protein